MKRISIVPVFVLLLFCYELNAQENLTVRPYARAGITLLPPSLEDLDYDPSLIDADIRRNLISSGAGVQIVMPREGKNFGIDVGATSLFVHKVILDQGVGISTDTDSEFSIYTLFFVEKPIAEPFFIQFGGGLHITPWFYDYYYDSFNYSDDSNFYSGVNVNFAAMVAAGAEIPLSSGINLLLLGKMDVILRYGLMVPISANIGLSFNL